MASINNQESNNNNNNNNKKKKPVATPTKKTPTEKNPTKKVPQNTDNGRATESPDLTASSSSDPEEIRQQTERNRTPSSKPNKANKRKQKARNDEDEEGDGSMFKFPVARVKRIMKSEVPTLQLPQDAVFLVNKATEKFIEQFCEEAYDCSVRDRKKSLAYKHLSTVVREKRRFDFLSDYVPEKLKAEVALEQKKLVENGHV